MQRQNRREFVRATVVAVSGVGMLACRTGANSQTAPPSPAAALKKRLVELEAELNGMIGLYAMAGSSMNVPIEYRADERFAMCSTFKWALAAAVLEHVDRGKLTLDAEITFTQKDILEYAPVASANLNKGSLSVSELAEAAVTVSDNTAANLLLDLIGGPSGLTYFFHNIGDKVSHLDRTEPLLNMNLPGDERDTTTPRAMARSLSRVLSSDVLSEKSRSTLIDWLVATQTGKERLRAGFPADLRAGDKTGTGNRGSANDVAVLWTSPTTPVFVASYMSGSEAPLKRLNAAHEEIGELVAAHFMAAQS